MHILKQSELDGMPCPDTLIHGDCLEAMKHIADGSVDAIIADLPYQTTKLKWDTLIPFEPLWEAYKRVIKPNGAIVLFGSQPFTSTLVMSNPKWFRYELIWDKVNRYTGHLSSAKIPMKRHENILIFYKSMPTYNKQYRTGGSFPQRFCQSKHGQHLGIPSDDARQERQRCANDGTTHNPCSIIPIKGKVNSEIGLHPTQKPSALLEMLVKTYTNPGDLVLDNVMGSGTLPVACLNTGRHFIGIEKDDAYFDTAVTRVRTREIELASTLGL